MKKGTELNLKIAINHLNLDPVMRKVISKHPPPKWSQGGNLFQEIAENILGQQLSGKAANTIIDRFKKLFQTKSFPNLKEILAMPDEQIRSCGTSWTKVSYLKNLSQAVESGQLNLETIRTLPDEEVISQLIKIKGIGRWTAEMILIFHLQRPDVFSCGDLGLCTAISKLYGIDRKDTKKIMKLSQRWSPFRTVASRYLWISLDNKS